MDNPIGLAFMKKILNAFDEAVYVVDRSKTVVYCNDQTERLMKIKREDFVGKDYVKFLESIHNDRGERATKESMAMHTIEDGIERQISNYYLWCFTNDDGFLSDIKVTALRDESGEIEGVLIRVKDVTPKK